MKEDFKNWLKEKLKKTKRGTQSTEEKKRKDMKKWNESEGKKKMM